MRHAAKPPCDAKLAAQIAPAITVMIPAAPIPHLEREVMR